MMVSIVTSRGGLLLFSIIILLLLFLTDQALGGTAARRCSHDEPPIRIPFRVVEGNDGFSSVFPVETDSHAYPVGFDISCYGATHLNLPSLDAKLIVTNIDYVSQEIQIENDHYDECLLTLLLLSENKISSSRPFKFPFQFKYDRRKNYTSSAVFNCSSPYFIPNSLCSLRLFPSNDEIYGQSLDVQSMGCTKMYDTQSIPDNIRTSYGYSDSTVVTTLTWAKPDCRSCKANRTGCRFKQHSHDEVECFHIPIQEKGAGIVLQVIRSTIFVVLASSVFSLMAAAASFFLYTIYEKDKEYRLRIGKFLEDYIAQKPSRYTYSDIKKITNCFKDKLGEGAYGTVFKGKLSNEILVAVKILNNSSKANNGEEFLNEVATIGQIHHVNVVRLVGYCAEGFRRALIYEFLPNGSLHNYISLEASRSGDRSPLSWEKLQEIATSVAKGIEYLHQGCDQRILHFDIKPHNVLLDHNFKPKISDFGLAKLCSKDQSLVSMTTARGTVGYMAPEVFSKNFGNVSYKADVYSFGMLLLEIVGRRKNTSETDEIYYPEWIYNLLEEGEDLRIQIENEEDNKIVKKLAIVGLWCIQWHSMGRPTMKVVVQMLEGEEALHMPPNPFVSTSQSNTHTTIPSRIRTPELETIVE